MMTLFSRLMYDVYLSTSYAKMLQTQTQMNIRHKQIINYKSIGWLLVAAILLNILLPAHYHLHHVFSGNSVTHDHIIDLHLITEKTGQSHHDEDTTIVTAAPDGIVKKSNPAFFPFNLLTILLVLLPLINYQTRLRLNYGNIDLKQIYYHLSPPLRAPPLH